MRSKVRSDPCVHFLYTVNPQILKIQNHPQCHLSLLCARGALSCLSKGEKLDIFHNQ